MMRLLAEKGIQFLTNQLAVIFDDRRWRKMCRSDADRLLRCTPLRPESLIFVEDFLPRMDTDRHGFGRSLCHIRGFISVAIRVHPWLIDFGCGLARLGRAASNRQKAVNVAAGLWQPLAGRVFQPGGKNRPQTQPAGYL
jgi:hypothetical protein